MERDLKFSVSVDGLDEAIEKVGKLRALLVEVHSLLADLPGKADAANWPTLYGWEKPILRIDPDGFKRAVFPDEPKGGNT